MQARETTQFVLRFTGPFSPLWLVVALPILLGLGWYLYKKQVEGVGRGTAAGLLAIRGVLVAGLLVLLFRPNLVHRRVLEYPGRILVAVDDSESISTSDNAMDIGEALYLARSVSGVEERGALYHQGASLIGQAVIRLKKFERYSAEADRNKDAFWRRAEATHKRVRKPLVDAEKLLSTADSERKIELQDLISELREDLSRFFQGSEHPGRSVFESYYSAAGDLVEELLEIQGKIDRERLKNGPEALRERVKKIRSTPRLGVLKKVLARVPEMAEKFASGQGLKFVRLMGEDTVDAESFAPRNLETQRGRTDILGTLEAAVRKDSKFPLSGVILFSDGRHLGKGSIENVVQEYSRRDVPIYTGTIGSTREPIDLAVLEVISPPFAVTDVEARVKVRVKASFKEPRKVEFRVRRGQDQVSSRTITLGVEPVETVELPFKPSEAGVFRYTVEAEGPGGESFPVRNNRMDFALHVRSEKIRVLLLDWKPRWETRFALNILRRLDYVELNSIIAVVQKGGKVPRGVRRGSWPEDEATLAMYDLVLLGQKSRQMLTDQEWENLAEYVRENGGTVGLLSPDVYRPEGGSRVLPPDLEEVLLPVREETPLEPSTNWDWSSPKGLKVGPAGVFHPTTRQLAATLARGKTSPEELLAPDSLSMLERVGSAAPVVATRLVGKGKVFLIGNENLWKALNPTILGAHSRLYVGLVSWVIEGGPPVPEEEPGLFLDERRGLRRDGMQVWVGNAGENNEIEAVDGDEVVARARTFSTGSALARAVFDPVPARNLLFRLRGQPEIASPEVVVTERYDELSYLAMNKEFLQRLADETGGVCRPLVEFEHFLAGLQPKERVETNERIWQLWDLPLILLFAGLLLTIEWVWRKLVGLV
ncbi:MAG: hypothetical protein ACLFWL_06385 [Candidatus Brocadiia bacterium]